MLAAKKALSITELEAQSAMELPDRAMPLITLVLVDLVDIGDITIRVRDVNVAAVICAGIGGVLSNVDGDTTVVCTVDQGDE